MLEKKLDFWLKNNFNVLLVGHKGCGKTSLILDCFHRNNIKFLYFSAATLDVWTDFVGLPKEIKIGDKSYLDFIKPQYFEDDIEAIYLDEFSRSTPKLRNSVMELIQFKSINGKKFPKLRVVWAAINPNEEEQIYDVDELDPAQKDRFQVIYNVPYTPSASYFIQKYGHDLANGALMWWKESEEKVKKAVSPRRLDYALEMFKLGGDLKDVLPSNANVNKLLVELTNGPITKKLKVLFETQNVEESRKFLAVENNYSACINKILKDSKYLNFFINALNEEKLSSLMAEHKSVEEALFDKFKTFEPVLAQIAQAGNSKIAKRVRSAKENLKKQEILQGNLSGLIFTRYYNPQAETDKFTDIVKNLKISSSTGERQHNYQILCQNLPLKLTPEQQTLVLEILVDVVNRSHAITVSSEYRNIVEMLNHVLAHQIEAGITPSLPSNVMNKLKQHPKFILNIVDSIAKTAANKKPPQKFMDYGLTEFDLY